MKFKNLVAAGVVIALVAAACGEGDDVANENDAPLAAGACHVDTPDCEDTVVSDGLPLADGPAGSIDEPPILPGEPTGGPTSDGFIVDGGLTVSEALATEATGVIAVGGLFFDDGTGPRLCEVLAESYPPQCGGNVLPLADASIIDPDELAEAQGITWSDRPVTVLGEIIDGVLVPNLTVAG